MSSASILEKALRHHQKGQWGLAERHYRKIPKSDKNYPSALHYIGLIAHQTGNSEKAARIISTAAGLSPLDAEIRSNLGNALASCGRLKEAKRELHEAVRLDPRFAGAYNNLGLVLRRMGQVNEALECFQRAADLDTGLANIVFNWGDLLAEQADWDGASEKLEQALDLDPHHTSALHRLGLVYEELGRFQEAEICYAKMAKIQPDNVEAWVSLSNVSRVTGDLESARRHARKALVIDPHSVAAYRTLVMSGRSQEAEEEISQLSEILTQVDPDSDAAKTAHYALGKLFDENGDYDQAFAHYSDANRLNRYVFEAAENEKWVDWVMATFSHPAIKEFEGSGVNSDVPVFVIGMPRSGTTLVEQIIASHPRAAGAGELEYIPRFIDEVHANDGQMEAQTLRRYADHYLSLIRRITPDASKIVDKLPFNFFNVGLIRLIFPSAPIIHCRRNALDTCLSIYFTAFSKKYAFSTDLTDIGVYYRQYERMMAHWRTLFETPFMELDYEDLVGNQEKEIGKIIEYCGLDWDNACLKFHQTKRVVLTPSDWQVRQPMYTSSLDRWKNYEKHITELLEILELE